MAIQFIFSHSSPWQTSLQHKHIQSKLAFECCRMNKTDINSISVLTEFRFSISCSSDSSSSAEHILFRSMFWMLFPTDLLSHYATIQPSQPTVRRYYYIFNFNTQNRMKPKMYIHIITNNRSSSVQSHFNFNKLIAKFQFFCSGKIKTQ